MKLAPLGGALTLPMLLDARPQARGPPRSPREQDLFLKATPASFFPVEMMAVCGAIPFKSFSHHHPAPTPSTPPSLPPPLPRHPHPWPLNPRPSLLPPYASPLGKTGPPLGARNSWLWGLGLASKVEWHVALGIGDIAFGASA